MTEIFDQAKAIADVKTPAFEIANDIRDTTAAAATSAPITINAPSVDVEALKAQMDNAYHPPLFPLNFDPCSNFA